MNHSKIHFIHFTFYCLLSEAYSFWCSFLEFITPKMKCSWVHNFIIIVHICTTKICPNESSRYPALNWHFFSLENYEALWTSWTLCLLLWLSRMIKSCTTILLTAYEPTPNVSGQVFIHDYQTEFIHFRKDGKKKLRLIANEWTPPDTTTSNKHKRELKVP